MRYSRQEIYLGKKAQRLIEKAKVSIIGLGALGTVSAELLARSGIGELILIDRDTIEESNLQRQSLFTESDLNLPKAVQAKKALEKINSKIKITSYFDHLDNENIKKIKAELILDCTDNLETRFLLNEFAIKNKISLIYASAIRNKGYVYSILNNKPCLKCILKNSETTETCETSGVLNTITVVVASLQVNEVIKILANKKPEENLIFIDLENNSITKIKTKKDPKCPVCNNKFEYLSGKKSLNLSQHCNSFILKKNFNFNETKRKLRNIGIQDFGDVFKFQNMTIFKNSVLIKSKSKKEAFSAYSKYIGN